MFQVKKLTTNHVCAIAQTHSQSYLPPLPPQANSFQRIKRFCKKLILVSESNPSSFVFYRQSSIADRRREQVETGSWVIHPFSTFRLYYEMWMSLVFFLCLVYMPLHASFAYLFHAASYHYFHYFLCIACYIDIVINFTTGACVSQEQISMERGRIARHYVLGVYFVCDVLSSIPHVEFADDVVTEYLSFFSILKIVRMMTFLEYFNRTLTYFRFKGFFFLMTRLIMKSFLILHFVTCFTHFLELLSYSLRSESSKEHNVRSQARAKGFRNFYGNYAYTSASMFIGVDISVNLHQPWVNFVFWIILYIVGKLLMSLLSVVLLDVFYISNVLEIKYQEMMSQVDSYMSSHRFPVFLQERMRKFYYYKYGQKYINETRIGKFISDKLKKEIKFHDCRQLIRSVKIFESLPQEIVEDMLPYLRKEIFLGRDVIVKAGSAGDCMYFLETGTVAVSSPSGKEICHLVDGDYFGELCLIIPKMKRTATIVALEMCALYKLERKHFRKCVETHKEVYTFLQQEAKKRYAETKDIERVFMKSFRD